MRLNRYQTVKRRRRIRRLSGMRNKRAFPPHRGLLAAGAVPAVLLIATVAGCTTSSSSSSAPGAMSAPRAAASSAAAGVSSAAGAAPGSGLNNTGAPPSAAVKYVTAAQQIIYTAQLTVRAPDVMTAVSRATSIVAAAGGYVSGENASAGNGQPGQATAT